MERVIGIDLGTSNSCVAVVEGDKTVVIPDERGRKTQSSVVSFFQDNKTLVGSDAREQMVYNPEHTVFSSKRLIGRSFSSDEVQTMIRLVPYRIEEGPNNSVLIHAGEKIWALPQLSAMILERMKRIAQNYLGEEINKAVITVPANFNEGQRIATKQAGELSGMNVLKIINEPTAAALSYGFGQGYDQRIAVYDFGGGTFDITILEIHNDIFEVITTAGDTFLGGDDIDNRIVRMIVNSYQRNFNVNIDEDPVALLRVRAEAEKAKIALSSKDTIQIKIPSLMYAGSGKIDLNVTLNRSNFQAIARDVIQQSFVICDEAFRLAHLDVSDIDNVVLVGGTTHIPLVRKMVEDYFGKQPYWGVPPDESVAMGAAIQGSILANVSSGLDEPSSDAVLLDVTSLSLGVGTVAGRIEKIIDRNTPIPVERTRLFTTSRDGQTSVRIRVYQGESEYEEENDLMGVLELSGLDPESLRGEVEIAVTFEIDTNGIVQVSAVDNKTGRKTTARIDLLGAAPLEGLFDYDDDMGIDLIDEDEA